MLVSWIENLTITQDRVYPAKTQVIKQVDWLVSYLANLNYNIFFKKKKQEINIVLIIFNKKSKTKNIIKKTYSK